MGKQNSHLPNLNVVVVGCTPLARHAIHAIKDLCNVVGVMSLSPEKGLTKSNYDSLKDLNGQFVVAHTNDINYEMNWLKDKNPDIILQCGWSQIFKPCILDIPNKYCLGLHPSPLPKGRGAAILNWKIIESNGKDVEWGNSLFVMESKTDTGAILDFEPFVIEKRDDIRTAYLKVDDTSITMLKRTIPKILNNTVQSKEQEKAKSTRFYKRRPEDGEIFLNWDTIKINDYVRALTHPYPGAFLKTKLGKIFIWKVSRNLSFNSATESGNILCINKNGILVQAAERPLWLQRISTKSTTELWADVWAHRQGLKVGDNILSG